MYRASFILFLLLAGAGRSAAQRVEIYPAELRRVPNGSLAGGRYWQQLRITLEHDDAPGNAALSLELPLGMNVADIDADGSITDEIRVVYEPAASEVPGFSVSAASTPERIVLGSGQPAAPGGRIYLQYPVVTAAIAQTIGTRNYGAVDFGDPRERDMAEGPALTYIALDDFALALNAMDVVRFSSLLIAGAADTSTSGLGTFFPEAPGVLILSLPDLIFDGGAGTSSNLLGLGDGDDGNDVQYRFFFSQDPVLSELDTTTTFEASNPAGASYTERERGGAEIQLSTRELPAGTYYLYAFTRLTGLLPLGRSRALRVRHEPRVQKVGPLEGDVVLDSGGLFDPEGEPKGRAQQRIFLPFSVLDHDDSPVVHLFYSAEEALSREDIQLSGGRVSGLRGAGAITPPEGLQQDAGGAVWDITRPQIVPQGDYFIFAVASDGKDQDLRRSPHQVRVRHAPFLRLDALDDLVLEGADTLVTGGAWPQRFVTLSWGRSGSEGDADLDDNARIALYYSTLAAAATAGADSFAVPGGAAALRADTLRAHLIVANLPEDPDGRADNQFVWDLWTLAREGGGVPEAGRLHYVYGIIDDGKTSRLAQMNGGRLNDAASRLVFLHPPSLRLLQPVADITVRPGRSGRVEWEDMDLDDDARIRLVLSAQDRGEIADYESVTAGLAYVLNSAEGRAAAAVDSAFDLSEDSLVDYFDMRIDHLRRAVHSDEALRDGSYHLYAAITETDSFDAHTLAWKAPGRVVVEGVDAPIEEERAARVFRLFPEAFSLGGGEHQAFELRVDPGGERIDQVLISLSVDAGIFAVVDQDSAAEGLQPFRVGAGFSETKVVDNQALALEGDSLLLNFAYLEPTAGAIARLDSAHVLARMELVALARDPALGPAPALVQVRLEADPQAGRISRLERDGRAVLSPAPGPLSEGVLVDGRATIAGELFLEGRSNMSTEVDFSLRPRGGYAPVEDPVFAAANDVDPGRAGVQVGLGQDGAFVLRQVPPGRFDLHVQRAGYLDAWAPGLELYPAQSMEGVRPTTSGKAADSLMLGGDVAGYTEVDGTSRPDNEVTLADWDFTSAFFGRNSSDENFEPRADITGDGRVDIRDLSLVGANFLGRGPRPVFKAIAPAPAPQLWLAGTAEGVVAGQEVEFSAMGAGLQGVRAYEVELRFDARQWTLVQSALWRGALPALSTRRRERGRERVGVSLQGRGTDLGGVEILSSWRLRARVDAAARPQLGEALLVDWRQRALQPRRRVGEVLPRRFVLRQNFPNPFNPETTIPFVVPAGAGGRQPVRLEIFNALGQLVVVLWEGMLPPGEHRLQWKGLDRQGRAVGSGVYFYRLHSGGTRLVKRMLLLR